MHHCADCGQFTDGVCAGGPTVTRNPALSGWDNGNSRVLGGGREIVVGSEHDEKAVVLIGPHNDFRQSDIRFLRLRHIDDDCIRIELVGADGRWSRIGIIRGPDRFGVVWEGLIAPQNEAVAGAE